MADQLDKSTLQTLFEGIRDERRLQANTAYRIGSAFLSLLHFYTESRDERYLSRIDDDTAKGIITFLKGIKLGSDFSFNSDGSIIAHSIASKGANESEKRGFIVAQKQADGKYQLCIDEIVAWGLATVDALHVQGSARFDDTIGSPDFVSGFLDGKGWRLKNVPVTNAAGVQENRYNLELDNLIVRGTMRIFEMIVSQLLGENDNRIFTAMLEVDHYEAESGKVYLDTHDGRMLNPFRRDDCIMVQQYNGQPSDDNGHYVTKSYDLIVTEVGTEGEGENMLAWVKFKGFTSPTEGATPERLIAKRDTFVRVDNLSNPERKGIIQMMTVGADTPYMDVVYGAKTNSTDAIKGRVGNLQGISHPIFGQLRGFGEFLQNLYATGDFILRRTGESIDTKIQMLQNQFATRFAQTSYDVTEENNYLHNGQFLTATGSSDDNLIIDGWIIDENEDTEFWIDADGMPVMVNGAATVSGNHRVSIDDAEGRNVLHIQDSGLSQANSLIRKPGTHKEYIKPSGDTDDGELAPTGEEYVVVQDTIYITAVVYAKTTGALTIGFAPCETIDGATNDMASRSIDIPYTGEWAKIKLEGKWDGTGDFVIRYTGDILISMVTITDEPLENLSKTVSTQIIQTAKNIKLLGSNIDKVRGTVTQLGIDIDAEKEAIRLYVDQKNEKLNESLSSQIDIQAGRIDLINQSQNETDEKISGIYTDIDSITATVSSVSETANGTKTDLAELKITVDGINTAVGSAATKDELSDNINTLKGAMDDLRTGEYYEQEDNPWSNWFPGGSEYKHIGAIWKYTGDDKDWLIKGHIYRYKCYDGSTTNSKYAWEDVTVAENTAAVVSQNAKSWSVAAGNFNEDGSLTESSCLMTTATAAALLSNYFDSEGNLIKTSGLMTTADANKLLSNYFDSEGNLIKTSGLVTTKDFSNLFAEAVDDSGIMMKAEMGVYVTKDDNGYVSNAKIKADNIRFEGSTTTFNTGEIVINSQNFSLDEDGNVEVGGKIHAKSIYLDLVNDDDVLNGSLLMGHGNFTLPGLDENVYINIKLLVPLITRNGIVTKLNPANSNVLIWSSDDTQHVFKSESKLMETGIWDLIGYRCKGDQNTYWMANR